MQELILTAASSKYFDSLCGLVGSLRANWPDHPHLVIYDIGLSEVQVNFLRGLGLDLRKLESFCDHWRLHYTWKVGIIKQHEFDRVIWMDAGIVVMRPLDGLFEFVQRNSVLFVPNYCNAAEEANDHCIAAAGLTRAFLRDRSSIAGNFMGFSGDSLSRLIISATHKAAMVEKNIKAAKPSHRHDQALFTCMLYKHSPNYVFADGQVYAGWGSPRRVNGQLVWAQRRSLISTDIEVFKQCMMSRIRMHFPTDPGAVTPFYVKWKQALRGKIGSLLKGRINNGVR